MKTYHLYVLFLIPAILNSQEWENYRTSSYIQSIAYADSVLWLDTESGLIRYNLSTGEIFRDLYFDSLYPVSVHHPSPDLNLVSTPEHEVIAAYNGAGLFKRDLSGNWNRYDTANTNMPYVSFTNIKTDRNDTLWIQQGYFICRQISEYNFDTLYFPSKEYGTISDFCFDTLNKLWVITEKKIVYYDNNIRKMIHFPDTFSNGIAMSAIQIDQKNQPWITGSYGNEWNEYFPFIAYWNQAEWVFMSPENTQMPTHFSIDQFFIDENDTKWFTNFGGIFRLQQDTLEEFLWVSQDYHIQDVLIADESEIYIGTKGFGLVIWDGTLRNPINLSENSLPGYYITSLAADQSGGVWISSYSSDDYGVGNRGINYWYDHEWLTNDQLVTQIPGAQNNAEYLFCDSKDNIWSLSYRDIRKYNGSSWQKIEDVEISALSFDMTEDPTGNIWVSWDMGTYRFDGVNWEPFALNTSGFSKAICADHNNTIWTGNYHYISRYDGDTFLYYNCANIELPCSPDYLDIAVDHENVLWFGSSKGIIRFDGEVWTRFTFTSGSNFIYSVMVDENNVKYFGTLANGLILFDNVKWTVLNAENSPLIMNTVYCITQDANGYVWAGTRYGLSRLRNYPGTNIDLTQKLLSSAEITSILDPEPINVYPNPCNDILSIQFMNDTPSFIHLEVYDMRGTKVIEEFLTSEVVGTQTYFLDVEKLYSGNYQLRIYDGMKSFSTKIFVQ